MRIPGGDLMPARHRRYGGTYGRRRRRNRRVLAGLLLVALGGAGFWYLRDDRRATESRVDALPTCAPTPTPVATTPPAPVKVVLPPPTAVTLTVLNGTTRSLLAKRVADQLAEQGFRVTAQGNAPKALEGPSQVVYGPGASLLARTTSAWVRGATVVPAPKARRGSVQLVLGSGFTRLSTPAEAAAATRTAPVPAVTSSPSPGVPTCRS